MDSPLLNEKGKPGLDLLDFTPIAIRSPESLSQKGPPKCRVHNWGIWLKVIIILLLTPLEIQASAQVWTLIKEQRGQ